MLDVAQTLAERGARYGDFTDHAAIAQKLQDVMRAPGDGWNLLSPAHKQALTVIADKIARILSGDPNYVDNWHDIQGYAKLAEDRCEEPELPLAPSSVWGAAGYPPSSAVWAGAGGGAGGPPPARAESHKEDSDWITWAGGRCPVPLETRVFYKMRDGSPPEGPDVAITLRWFHAVAGDDEVDPAGDIVAYRVAEND